MPRTDVNLLLIEDNQNDIELTRRALSKQNLADKHHYKKFFDIVLYYATEYAYDFIRQRRDCENKYYKGPQFFVEPFS